MVLNGEFTIVLRNTEQEVRKTVSRVRRPFTTKAECALRGSEQILNFLIDGPAPAKSELVRSLRPGNVVTDLVVVGFIAPGPTRDLEVCSALPVERNIRDAGQVVRPRKQAGGCAVVSTGKGQALQAIRRKRDDVDAVTVIVEGHLVDQRWVDGVCRVDHAAIRRIPKRVSNCRKVIPAPLGGSVALRDLFGNEVPEHRELAGEIVIDAHNLFPEIGRNP